MNSTSVQTDIIQLLEILREKGRAMQKREPQHLNSLVPSRTKLIPTGTTTTSDFVNSKV